MDIKLQRIPLENAQAITRVQLFERSGVRLLAGAGREVSAVENLAGGARSRAAFRIDSEPGNPAWEARPLDGEGFSWVYTRPGSAISWLMSSTSGGESVRWNSESFAVYTKPRYVRGDESGRAVTTICLENGRPQVELFTRHLAAGYAPSRRLDQPRSAIEDALLVRAQGGYWLFLLLPVPGASGESRASTTGARTPAVLHVLRLNEDFEASGAITRVFGDHPAYEFDAAPLADGRVAIFATTPPGAIFALGNFANSPLAANDWKETPLEFPLASPSLLIHNATAHLAGIRDLGKPDAAAVYGSLPL